MEQDKKTGKFLPKLKVINCFVCNNLFRPVNSKVKMCSYVCGAKFRMIRQKTGIMKKCEICLKEFYVRNSLKNILHCCSLPCGIIWRSHNRKNLKFKSSLIEKQCEQCEQKFFVYPSLKGRYCSHDCSSKANVGKSTWNKGKLLPKMTGKNHPRWIEDRTKLKIQHERNDSTYQEWRKKVWIRDNFKCKIENNDCGGKIEVHHILIWSDYPELRYEINNGITLCRAHHPRKRAEEKQLVPYFMGLIEKSKV